MAIVSGVQAGGVRTGESWGWLLRRLEDRTYEAPAGGSGALQPAWRIRLCLGNLWD